MANLDTTSKRRSSVQVLAPWLLAPPAPDGALAQADRQHIAWSYSGILAGAVTVPDVGTRFVSHAHGRRSSQASYRGASRGRRRSSEVDG
jgi:hypothetical protein